MNKLVKIMTNHPDPVHATSEWRWKFKGKLLCSECLRINCSGFSQTFDVVLENHPGHRIEGGVWDTGINIFHVNFIEQLYDYLSEYTIGRCLDKSGKVISDYVTCYGKSYILVRGDKKSKYWTCKTCGAIAQSGWSGPQYVLRSYLSDSRIYQDASCRMFIDEELASQLDFSPWPDAELEPIAIRDEPIDGQVLPIDPGYVKPAAPNSESTFKTNNNNLME
jgi:hypothetical protein